MVHVLESSYESPKLQSCSHQLAHFFKDLLRGCLKPLIQAHIYSSLARENNGLSSSSNLPQGFHWQTLTMNPVGRGFWVTWLLTSRRKWCGYRVDNRQYSTCCIFSICFFRSNLHTFLLFLSLWRLPCLWLLVRFS